jgi:hypothetical protein
MTYPLWDFKNEKPPVSRRFHYHLSCRAATPGSASPSSISSEAPPPVEICVILPATPDRLMAATMCVQEIYNHDFITLVTVCNGNK